MIKSLKELAWNVTEDEYRASTAISYSSLASFEREGPSCIPLLKQKELTDSLRFGSLVDTLLTEPEEFDNKFFISDFDKPSDVIQNIITNIWNNSDKKHNSLTRISEEDILKEADNFHYGESWKSSTRVGKIIEAGSNLYNLLALSENKTIVSTQDYDLARACIEQLKINKFTKDLFYENPFEDNIEHHFQLKFITTIEDLNVRCMFDKIIINHNTKIIYPIDLKTTSKQEEHFDESFIKWSYWIQSNMYSQILENIIKQDNYFKDFTIAPFTFVCINRYNQKPLKWVDFNNLKEGNRLDNNGICHKYWKILCKEYKWHLDNNIYDYSYDSIMNNGTKILNNLRIQND